MRTTVRRSKGSKLQKPKHQPHLEESGPVASTNSNKNKESSNSAKELAGNCPKVNSTSLNEITATQKVAMEGTTSHSEAQQDSKSKNYTIPNAKLHPNKIERSKYQIQLFKIFKSS
jgi:hypothetical protein